VKAVHVGHLQFYWNVANLQKVMSKFTIFVFIVTKYLNVDPVNKCPLHNISGNFQNESLSILHNLFPFIAAVLPCLQNCTPVPSNASNI
jgi:hypothetical protein